MSFLKAAMDTNDKSAVFKPQLTSLVDVMTILLVFLIKSFSVEGSLISPPQNIQLPVSESREEMQVLKSIDITSTALLVGEEFITYHEDYLNSDSLLIEPLFRYIENYTSTDNEESLLIQSDRDIEFDILKRVMYTCSKAGISDFNILVVNED
ncbi:biopolymer transport protein ExbD/TolR [Chitinispirillum alkaliphilum]|nr:biopolymer transport protein ExbD/TolR [Chitinispirillum alkaliphilum]